MEAWYKKQQEAEASSQPEKDGKVIAFCKQASAWEKEAEKLRKRCNQLQLVSASPTAFA